MGKFDFQVPDDFIKKLGKLSDVDRIAPKMIDAAIPILSDSIKRELAVHKETGSLVASVKKTRTRLSKGGYYLATVRPTGTDKKGVRNMEKLAILEYGVSNKDSGGWKQAPTPLLTKAVKDATPSILSKMKEVFEEEMKS